jgi:SAM-dependent methyltransferase
MRDRLARLFRLGHRQVVRAREGYAVWAETYPPWPHNPLMRAEQLAVEAIIAMAASCLACSKASRNAAAPARALDVGTGTGRCLPLLASAGARPVVGLDMSLAMLGRKAYGLPRVCADACRLPFPDASFDLICSSLMVGDLEDLGAWLGEVMRVLAPGGHLVYSDFHPTWTAERWRRTFRTADGRLFEISYFPHAIDEHLALLERAPFVVRAIREPRLAGRKTPVVVVFHAVKPRAPFRSRSGTNRARAL